MSNVRRATTGGRRAAFVIVLHSMWRRAEGKFALIVLALWLLIAIVSLFWTPQSLWATDGYHVWAKPSAEHWLGTDGTGADVFSWLLAGSHTNLVIVLLTVVASMAWGLLLIAAMVARNAALASSSVVVVDALISVPTVLIALILAVPLGASIAVIVIACGFGYGLNLARVARPAALLAARSSYVESALANGASGWRVLISHVMPNILPVLAVQLSLSAGTAVLAESGLTYLGIGVPSGVPSWGHSLATSVKLINVFPLTVVWPGLFVTLWFVACSVDINWGSILLMALGTQWYILFNVIAGASQIPDDLREMTRSFQLGRWQRWRDLILPAVFGSWVTGGITAAGGAWNASIVSEIVSYGRHTLTASGLGAYIAEATESGNTVRTIIGVTVMSVFVVAVNRLFWNPLQRMAERRFALN